MFLWLYVTHKNYCYICKEIVYTNLDVMEKNCDHIICENCSSYCTFCNNRSTAC